jgi:integrase/recombinase XerD
MNIGKYVKMYSDDLELKNYSSNTIKNYSCQVEVFLKHFNDMYEKPSEVNEESIKKYLLQFKTRNSMCHSLSALKLFYKLTIKQPMKFKYIEYPRSEKKLPKVIDKEFLIDKINSIQNLKHKTILSLAYSVGLRVSEVCNLKIKDVDSDRMLIHILNSKGRKDRIVPLSKSILELIVKYIAIYNPDEYLFNGQFEKRYSHRSCNEIVKKHLGEEYHFHLLRHSCFTTLLESGVDVSMIQKIAGHSNIRSTLLYTHISSRFLNKVPLPI